MSVQRKAGYICAPGFSSNLQTTLCRGWVHISHNVQVGTTHPRPGQRHLLTAPAPSQAIRGVLGKFADLPHEAEEEIRGLDEARRRIAELEREIKRLKGTSSVLQIDQKAVDHAAKAAVERERATWQRKLEQGRARFRRMVTAATSTGQALDQPT
jgi:hypothetical protein